MGVILNWSSDFPSSIDDRSTNFPSVSDGVHDVLAAHVNALADAMVAVENDLFGGVVRRDGSFEMTGDLNLGGNNLVNTLIPEVQLPEQGGDPTPVTDTGFVYTKDVGGVTELFYEDDTGAVAQLTDSGSLSVSPSLQNSYEGGSSIVVTDAEGSITFSRADTETVPTLSVTKDGTDAAPAISVGVDDNGVAAIDITAGAGDGFIALPDTGGSSGAGSIRFASGAAIYSPFGSYLALEGPTGNNQVRINDNFLDIQTGDGEYQANGETLLKRNAGSGTQLYGEGSVAITVFNDEVRPHFPVGLPEQASNPTNVADKGFVYTKDVSTVTELFYMDSDGNITQLTGGGSLSHSLQQAYDDGNTITLIDGTPIALTHDSPTADSLSILNSVGGQDIGLRPTGVFYGGPGAVDFSILGEVPTTVGADGRDAVWTGAPGAAGDGVTAGGVGALTQIIAGQGGASGGAGAGVGGDLDLRAGDGGADGVDAGDVFIGAPASTTETGLDSGGNVVVWTGTKAAQGADPVSDGSITLSSIHDVFVLAGSGSGGELDAVVDVNATGEIQLSSTTAGIVRIEDADLVFGTTDNERIARAGDSFEFYTNNQLTLKLRRQVDASTQNVGMALTPTVNLSGTNFYDGARVSVTESAVGDGTDDPDGLGNTLHRWRRDPGTGIETSAAITPDSFFLRNIEDSVDVRLEVRGAGGAEMGVFLNGVRQYRVRDDGWFVDAGAGLRRVGGGSVEIGFDGSSQPTLFETGGAATLTGKNDPGTPADGDVNLAVRTHQDESGTVTAALDGASLAEVVVDGTRLLGVTERSTTDPLVSVTSDGDFRTNDVNGTGVLLASPATTGVNAWHVIVGQDHAGSNNTAVYLGDDGAVRLQRNGSASGAGLLLHSGSGLAIELRQPTNDGETAMAGNGSLRVKQGGVVSDEPVTLAALDVDGQRALTVPGSGDTSVLTGSVKTTDGTDGVVARSFTLADNTVYWLQVEFVGRDQAGTERVGGRRTALVYREAGGNATIEGSVQLDWEERTNAGLNTAISVSGNDVQATVTGLAGTTIDWAVTMRLQPTT